MKTVNLRVRLTQIVLEQVPCRWSSDSKDATAVRIELMGGLLHLLQRGVNWAGPQPAQAPPRSTKCNSPPINGQCTNHRIAVRCSAVLMWRLKG